MKIANSIFAVTGGSSGLGAVTVQALVAKGAKVVILDLNEASEVLKVVGNDNAVFSKADVTSEAQVLEAIRVAKEKFPEIPFRGVVNCAGGGPPMKIVSRDGTPAPLSKFEGVVRLNLIGTFNVDRLIASEMVKNTPPDEENGTPPSLPSRGVLIHTASVAYQDGQAGQAAYSSSKAGVSGMSLPLARDLSPVGIRVVTIAPGIMLTPLMKAAPEKLQQSLAKGVEFPRRLGKPEEFSALVCHVIENSYLNAETIRLDAGIRLGKI
ncbi:3-hydroxyacyl-CoA dehydrogenase type-2 [Gonapodya prolifera JEL478]|uniref:3-hydroxyacyl-CoA dehydrogenase type-2 n=1 Tax=Gonapodya prolifera (strain JEL478) TaxID=1344416 RepID=A0A138ZWU7_GONPJ|nr:3-hydroxyacyl-CoA dehydrogenase type-2 [Gonapodya prolifera JEL478]|eukprot:KXS08989.1 3-hydroxyacyl-CoA dehydrogenase type-2 [Gonapodya prolifera JEL478]